MDKVEQMNMLIQAQGLASRIVMISEGQILASGTASELTDKYRASSLEELYITLTDRQRSSAAMRLGTSRESRT